MPYKMLFDHCTEIHSRYILHITWTRMGLAYKSFTINVQHMYEQIMHETLAARE